eukprot:TRINITY_DN9722_c1_g1_i1.p1 TRINITY_DN9722_c1_g1~~TRINITY_DN9722_c1_g1_i1.p1  ORF type:complete len:493 (+),score=142.94 TRINITY_DN9722_c1_g1_i1:100-1479(+)
MAAATGGVDSGFYAVYCLESGNPKCPGYAYIGFTVNPRRRIRQHNGEIQNGAWQTRRRRPWQMLCCVHGFTAKTLALQFEWAWQHPEKARCVRDQWAQRLKGRPGMGRAFTARHKLALLHLLLRVPPFAGLQLTLHVLLSSRFAALVSGFNAPLSSVPGLPALVSTVHGDWDMLDRVRACAGAAEEDDDEGGPGDGGAEEEDEEDEAGDDPAEGAPPRPSDAYAAASQRAYCEASLCCSCQQRLEADLRLSCPSAGCRFCAHPRCLAAHFYAADPTGGPDGTPWLVPRGAVPCPFCAAPLQWAAMVLRLKEATRKRRRDAEAEAQRSLKETRRRLRDEQRDFQLSQRAAVAAAPRDPIREGEAAAAPAFTAPQPWSPEPIGDALPELSVPARPMRRPHEHAAAADPSKRRRMQPAKQAARPQLPRAPQAPPPEPPRADPQPAPSPVEKDLLSQLLERYA